MLTPYLKEAVFDPNAIEVMDSAFAAVCASLQLAGPDDPLTEIAARTIIDLARAGERDPDHLCEGVVAYFRAGTPMADHSDA